MYLNAANPIIGMDAEQESIKYLLRTPEPKNIELFDDISLYSGHFTDADIDILKSPNNYYMESKDEHQPRVIKKRRIGNDLSDFCLSPHNSSSNVSTDVYMYNSAEQPSTSKGNSGFIYSNNSDLCLSDKDNHVDILKDKTSTANEDFGCSNCIKVDSDDATDSRKENNLILPSDRHVLLHQENNTNLTCKKAPGSRKTNAEIAKENRLKKKKHVQKLENDVEASAKEINALKQKVQELQAQRERDKDQIECQNNILANIPAISRFLDAMPHIPATKKMGLHSETCIENNADDVTSSAGLSPSNRSGAGVCLHFKPNTDHVSLEYCFICARSSQMSLKNAQQRNLKN